jgi:hypothetical protein
VGFSFVKDKSMNFIRNILWIFTAVLVSMFVIEGCDGEDLCGAACDNIDDCGGENNSEELYCDSDGFCNDGNNCEEESE